MQTIAKQVSRTGNFVLPCSADDALPLFTPEGERAWIETWNPRPVFPKTIAFCRDTVFLEGLGAEEAVWTIVEADHQTHRAEYVRVAPASHAAHIVVKIDPIAEGQSCQVTVSYTVTVFGEDSDALLAAFSEAAYADKMRRWQRQIGEYLNGCSGTTTSSGKQQTANLRC